MEFIEKHPDKDWNWDWISRNPNITMEMIEKIPKPWNWRFISENSNITDGNDRKLSREILGLG